ncbi:MAG TPA: transglutaminase domain-containing protein [Flavipsychrobacter sp.]|nr:transglutaminase domain-containing protein [Flavipsychrobacter sp.]
MEKIKIISFILIVILGNTTPVQAQQFNRDSLGPPIIAYVDKLQPYYHRPISTIIDSFKQQGYTQVELAYAIYVWIAKNVQFDSYAYHHKRTARHTPSATLENRAATSEGYSYLYKTMCDLAGIQCYVVPGFLKLFTVDIGVNPLKNKHYWNVLFINHQFMYVDVCLGAGTTDFNFRNFVKEFSDVWFLTSKQLFLFSHFSQDKSNPIPKSWGISKAEFIFSPIVYKQAIRMQLYPAPTDKGKIKTLVGKTKLIAIEMRAPQYKVVSIQQWTPFGELPISIVRQGDILLVSLSFDKSGEYPVIVKVNGKNTIGFWATVSKVKK